MADRGWMPFYAFRKNVSEYPEQPARRDSTDLSEPTPSNSSRSSDPLRDGIGQDRRHSMAAARHSLQSPQSRNGSTYGPCRRISEELDNPELMPQSPQNLANDSGYEAISPMIDIEGMDAYKRIVELQESQARTQISEFLSRSSPAQVKGTSWTAPDSWAVELPSEQFLSVPAHVHVDDFEVLKRPSIFNPPFVNSRTAAVRVESGWASMAGLCAPIIPVSLFRSAAEIEFLDISGNPHISLPSDFVQMCTRLVELRMDNCQLTATPTALVFSNVRWLSLRQNQVTDDGLEPLAAIMTLEWLCLSNNQLTNIPTCIGDLSRLRHLSLSNNNLCTLSGAIGECASLEYLDVSFNAIVSISPSIQSLEHLTSLNLNYNRLSSIDFDLRGLRWLENLDLSHNLLRDVSFLNGCHRLRVLNLSYNQIARINALDTPNLAEFSVKGNPLVFMSFSREMFNLATVDASDCRLRSFPFTDAVALEDIDLSGNLLTHIDESIAFCDQLKRLNVSANQLEEIPKCLPKLIKLRELDASRNAIKTVGLSVWRCRSLEVLNLAVNSLASFPEVDENSDSLLDASLELRELIVTDNELEEDFFENIQHLGRLQRLDASFNQITFIGHGFQKLAGLCYLRLAGNRLGDTPEGLESMPYLGYVFLGLNRLTTLPSDLGIGKTLVAVDASANILRYNIRNEEFDWNWNYSPDLHYLSLSGNDRLRIHPEQSSASDLAHFQDLKKLRVLDLHDVDICPSIIPMQVGQMRVRATRTRSTNFAYSVLDTLIPGQTDFKCWEFVNPYYGGQADRFLCGLFEALDSDGSGPARGLALHFPSVFAREVSRFPTVSEAFNSVVNILDDDLPSMGTVAFIRSGTLHVANVGNLHAALYRNGKLDIVTEVHDWTNEREMKRARMVHADFIGGHVPSVRVSLMNNKRTERYSSLPGMEPRPNLRASHKRPKVELAHNQRQRIFLNEGDPFEVEGSEIIAHSRAFGYAQSPANSVILNSPSVFSQEIGSGEGFLIIGTRAVWRTLDLGLIERVMHESAGNAVHALHRLSNLAVALGAETDVSLMIVDLRQRQNESGEGQSLVGSWKRSMKKPSIDTSEMNGTAPKGNMAIVFMDLPEAAWLWETCPMAMNVCQRAVASAICAEAAQWGGYRVKTDSNNYLLAFQRSVEAVRWAVGMHVRMAQIEWPDEILALPQGTAVSRDGVVLRRGLSMRAGMHFGMPVAEFDPVQNRMDYLGSVVNRAARLKGIAENNTIVVSEDFLVELRREGQIQLDLVESPVALNRSSGIQFTDPFSEAAPPHEAEPDAALGHGPVLRGRILGAVHLKGIEVAEYPVSIDLQAVS